MDQIHHTVLCVDDEKSILNSLKRLLRREGYRLLMANTSADGLKLLRENDVHLVICDQRMPEMSGTDFMVKVKEEYPDTVRIILTGYTDVDAITESINKGNIYKFFLKPWNDDNLKMEVRKALEQYNLVQANKKLQEKIMEQNKELQKSTRIWNLWCRKEPKILKFKIRLSNCHEPYLKIFLCRLSVSALMD